MMIRAGRRSGHRAVARAAVIASLCFIHISHSPEAGARLFFLRPARAVPAYHQIPIPAVSSPGGASLTQSIAAPLSVEPASPLTQARNTVQSGAPVFDGSQPRTVHDDDAIAGLPIVRLSERIDSSNGLPAPTGRRFLRRSDTIESRFAAYRSAILRLRRNPDQYCLNSAQVRIMRMLAKADRETVLALFKGIGVNDALTRHILQIEQSEPRQKTSLINKIGTFIFFASVLGWNGYASIASRARDAMTGELTSRMILDGRRNDHLVQTINEVAVLKPKSIVLGTQSPLTFTRESDTEEMTRRVVVYSAASPGSRINKLVVTFNMPILDPWSTTVEFIDRYGFRVELASTPKP